MWPEWKRAGVHSKFSQVHLQERWENNIRIDLKEIRGIGLIGLGVWVIGEPL